MAQKLNKAKISSEEIIQLSQKIVKRYVNRGSIPKREEDDIMMGVVEKFLVKKEDIVDKFKGQSKFSTYCVAVMNRMCCEIIRKEIKHWNLSENQHENFSSSGNINSDDRLLIEDEINILKKLILFLGVERHKVKLFFAYYYKLRIHRNDINNYDSQYIEHQLDELFLSDNNLSKGQIFSNLAHVVNLVENRKLKPDAVRMWLNKNRGSLIDRLNKLRGQNNYDTDSFQALFEYFYDNEKVKEIHESKTIYKKEFLDSKIYSID
jgi:hypothetical protein